MLNIISGTIPRAVRVVIYGQEGIGKTTLATKIPGKTLMIDLEDGASFINCDHLPTPTTWEELIALLGDVAQNPQECDTIIVDTLDKAESLCADAVIRHANRGRKNNEKQIEGIEDFGYGKGYQYMLERFRELLEACDKCIEAGINTVLISHMQRVKFEEPDNSGAYDRYELKLSKKIAPEVKGWCDALLFCKYKTTVINDDGKTKARGGERVIQTTHSASWDAKNRFGLASTLPLDVESIKSIFPAPGTIATVLTATDPVKKLDPVDQEILKGIESIDESTKKKELSPTKKKVNKLLGDTDLTITDFCRLCEKGGVPSGTKFEDYDDNFIETKVISKWTAFATKCKELRDSGLPF